MAYFDLLLEALKFVLAILFLASAGIGMLIVTSNFIHAVTAGERLLRFLTGDNPKRLQVQLLALGAGLSLIGFAAMSAWSLAAGLIFLAWAALHHQHRSRNKNKGAPK
ncbi:MAG: hypothetical protein R3245_04405 [Kiloniellales bacterium]|nr:hypothetical protein [Kiloniellales bacterium]